jgi:hypothetical protein
MNQTIRELANAVRSINETYGALMWIRDQMVNPIIDQETCTELMDEILPVSIRLGELLQKLEAEEEAR